MLSVYPLIKLLMFNLIPTISGSRSSIVACFLAGFLPVHAQENFARIPADQDPSRGLVGAAVSPSFSVFYSVPAKLLGVSGNRDILVAGPNNQSFRIGNSAVPSENQLPPGLPESGKRVAIGEPGPSGFSPMAVLRGPGLDSIYVYDEESQRYEEIDDNKNTLSQIQKIFVRAVFSDLDGDGYPNLVTVTPDPSNPSGPLTLVGYNYDSETACLVPITNSLTVPKETVVAIAEAKGDVNNDGVVDVGDQFLYLLTGNTGSLLELSVFRSEPSGEQVVLTPMGSREINLQADENISKVTAIPGTDNPEHLVTCIFNPLTGTTLISEIDLTTGEVPNKKALPIDTLPGDQFVNFECLGGRLSFFNTLGTPDEIGGVSTTPENPRSSVFGEQDPDSKVIKITPTDQSWLAAILDTTQILHGSTASDLSITNFTGDSRSEVLVRPLGSLVDTHLHTYQDRVFVPKSEDSFAGLTETIDSFEDFDCDGIVDAIRIGVEIGSPGVVVRFWKGMKDADGKLSGFTEKRGAENPFNALSDPVFLNLTPGFLSGMFDLLCVGQSNGERVLYEVNKLAEGGVSLVPSTSFDPINLGTIHFIRDYSGDGVVDLVVDGASEPELHLGSRSEAGLDFQKSDNAFPSGFGSIESRSKTVDYNLNGRWDLALVKTGKLVGLDNMEVDGKTIFVERTGDDDPFKELPQITFNHRLQFGNFTGDRGIEVLVADGRAGEFQTYSTGQTSPRDTDRDGMPDEWEEDNGLNPFNPVDARRDNDGDGASNITEYYLMRDPNNPNDDAKTLLPRLTKSEDDPSMFHFTITKPRESDPFLDALFSLGSSSEGLIHWQDLSKQGFPMMTEEVGDHLKVTYEVPVEAAPKLFLNQEIIKLDAAF